jgi:hypothetical protein
MIGERLSDVTASPFATAGEPLVRIPHFSGVEAENPLRLLNTAIASMRPAYAAVLPIKSSDGESNLTFETGS